jgi:serine protease Do
MRNTIGRWTSQLRVALLGGSLLLAGSSLAFTQFSGTKRAEVIPVRVTVSDKPVEREGRFITSFAPVVKQVAPSVVSVETLSKARSAQRNPFLDDPFFRRFFGEEFGQNRGRATPQPRQMGVGSGVVITSDGYILTNNHVVENADEVKITLTDGRQFTAKVVGKDPKTDIAVLKIDGSDLPHITIADSDLIEVGDLVLAIGNPFNIGQTVTMGMVSGTGRAAIGLDYEDFIQTDAAINPGNSGGALVDAEGRLIGINTAIYSRSGGNQGIGFAIPANLARSVMEGLIQDGRVVRGFIGVNIQDLNPALARQFKLKETAGALVTDVSQRGPAERAGLQNGDVILEFNGKPVRDTRQLRLAVAQTRPSEKVPVKIMRDGKSRTLEVVPKEFPEDMVADRTGPGPSATPGEILEGVTLTDVDASARRLFNLSPNVRGALVRQIDPESAAYKGGLREGDVIVEMNRQPVRSADEAVELSEKIDDGTALLRVSRGGAMLFVVPGSEQ